MDKPITQRLNYFTKQLNKYSKQRYDYLLRRADKQAPSNRFDRLMVYKELLHKAIESSN